MIWLVQASILAGLVLGSILLYFGIKWLDEWFDQ